MSNRGKIEFCSTKTVWLLSSNPLLAMAFCFSFAKLAFTNLYLSSSFFFMVDLDGRIVGLTLMHLNYGVISGSHACRDSGWHIILVCRALYNLPWRASVSSHQVQCNIPTFEALLRKYKYLFLERCRKSNNLRLRALMQSDCLYSSLFFEHYNRILLCD